MVRTQIQLTEEQAARLRAAAAREGISLDAQTTSIRAWCEAHEYRLLSVHEDAGISGGRADNRPGLREALDLACSLKGALIVYSLSRLARSTRDALQISERLDRAGADLVSISERIDTTSVVSQLNAGIPIEISGAMGLILGMRKLTAG